MYVKLEGSYAEVAIAINLEMALPNADDCRSKSAEAIKKDLPRSQFVSFTKSFPDLIASWSGDNLPLSFSQGNISGNVFSFRLIRTFIGDPSFIGESKLKALLPDCNVNEIVHILMRASKTGLTFAYYDDANRPCGVSIAYIEGHPDLWVASVITNTNADVKDCQVKIYGNSPILNIFNKENPKSFTSIEHPKSDFLQALGSESIKSLLSEVLNNDNIINVAYFATLSPRVISGNNIDGPDKLALILKLVELTGEHTIPENKELAGVIAWAKSQTLGQYLSFLQVSQQDFENALGILFPTSFLLNKHLNVNATESHHNLALEVLIDLAPLTSSETALYINDEHKAQIKKWLEPLYIKLKNQMSNKLIKGKDLSIEECSVNAEIEKQFHSALTELYTKTIPQLSKKLLKHTKEKEKIRIPYNAEPSYLQRNYLSLSTAIVAIVATLCAVLILTGILAPLGIALGSIATGLLIAGGAFSAAVAVGSVTKMVLIEKDFTDYQETMTNLTSCFEQQMSTSKYMQPILPRGKKSIAAEKETKKTTQSNQAEIKTIKEEAEIQPPTHGYGH